jgi:sortase A
VTSGLSIRRGRRLRRVRSEPRLLPPDFRLRVMRKFAGPGLFALIGIACVAGACWIHIKAMAAQVLINAAWDRTREGAQQSRPWPWADTKPIARITFHDWKTLVVLEGSSGRNLAFAPSHDAASVLPGETGNSVISAHRDTHFRELEHARRGDGIRVERADGSVFLFSVTNVRVVDSRKTRVALESDTPRLTLVTCYPFDAIQPGGPLRFVVTADLSAGAGYTPPRRVARAAALPRPVPLMGPVKGLAAGLLERTQPSQLAPDG